MSELDLQFDGKAVRYHWLKVSREEWRLDPDPIKSAMKFITEHGAEHQIAIMDIEAQRE